MLLTGPRARLASLLLAGATALGVAAVAPAAGAAGAPTHGILDPSLHGVTGTAGVIVQGARSAEAAVSRLGGRVVHDLPLIGGFSAQVPAANLGRLAQLPGVRYVTIDGKMAVAAASAPGGGSTGDVYKTETRTTALQQAGYAGQGVTVALIDTGVTPMADVASRLVTVTTDPLGATTAQCVNLTSSPTCDDEYGHGTFLAGLIAGTGAASGGQYLGAAPKARILSVKVAGADGSSDVSTIIAALQWVISSKDVYGIKVLNLSLGTDGTQSYLLSPLDFAVEQAWRDGITVVVSASNLGPAPKTIDKPADDPFVLTVGAIDDMGTPSVRDDTVPNFSSRGPTAADGLAKPDLAAPGAHLVSLAAPGASITTLFPSSMAAPYRRGSGTSMSAAVTSGIVADVLSANPGWSPDRVKFALTATAQPAASTDRMAVGAGLVDAYDAAFNAPPGLANQGLPPSTGLGSLQLDRGSASVQLAGVDGTVVAAPLSAEVTAQLGTWDPNSMLTALANGTSWYGTSWYGTSWYGTSWYGTSWYGTSWYGTSWYGQPNGTSWYGTSWYGSSWYGAWDQ